MRRWLLDRLVLQPTRDPLPVESLERRLVAWSGHAAELWGRSHGAFDSDDPHVTFLKFPGTGGRAERAGVGPLHRWEGLRGRVWAVNPPGYGTAPGRASLTRMPDMVEAIGRWARDHAGPGPLIVTGNSLGTLSALRFASRFPCDGLILRNPPPLSRVIEARGGRWGARWLGRWLGRGVPDELDAVANAARCTCPALFIQSERDTLVPPGMQSEIVGAYAGPRRTWVVPEIDHGDPIPESAIEDYDREHGWLRRSLGLEGEVRDSLPRDRDPASGTG